jgi:hypothetical protein
VSFNATFTVTSGGTTIIGTFATPTYARFSVGFLSGSTGAVVGHNLNGAVNRLDRRYCVAQDKYRFRARQRRR